MIFQNVNLHCVAIKKEKIELCCQASRPITEMYFSKRLNNSLTLIVTSIVLSRGGSVSQWQSAVTYLNLTCQRR